MNEEVTVRYDRHTLAILSRKREWVFAADPEGRLFLVHTPQAIYRRSHLNVWKELSTEPWPVLRQTSISTITDQLPAWKEVWKMAMDHVEEKAPRQILKNWLERFTDFHKQDAEHFHSVYDRIPILPPDAYQQLYLRITRGCPWNRCSFCNFYEDDHFGVPPLEDLEKHIAAVRNYWQSALYSRRGIFLGDANALAVPASSFIERLNLIRSRFPEPEFQEIHAFMDFFCGARRSTDNFRDMFRAGLSRISIGIESGHLPLMKAMQKFIDQEHLIHTISSASEGGIHLNLIFLIGLGGHHFREAHFADSMNLIGRMRRIAHDRIFLSPLVVSEGTPYTNVETANSWGVLSEEEVKTEVSRWRDEIHRIQPAVQVSLYNIRQFAY